MHASFMSSKKSRKSTAIYKIKWEALEDKDLGRKQFASSMTTKFRQFPDEADDIEM